MKDCFKLPLGESSTHPGMEREVDIRLQPGGAKFKEHERQLGSSCIQAVLCSPDLAQCTCEG